MKQIPSSVSPTAYVKFYNAVKFLRYKVSEYFVNYMKKTC